MASIKLFSPQEELQFKLEQEAKNWVNTHKQEDLYLKNLKNFRKKHVLPKTFIMSPSNSKNNQNN